MLLCGVFAGAVAGLATNGPETLAVKKQTKPNFSIAEYMRKPGVIGKIMFRGAAYRTCYYGIQSCMLFFLLEKFKERLAVETMDD